MKRFLTFNTAEKKVIKMTNQSDKGFDLIALTNELIKKIIETKNLCEANGDELYIVWQMKFKTKNYILYRNCKLSDPIDNSYKQPASDGWNRSNRLFTESETVRGKKFTVNCKGSSFYSRDEAFINAPVLNPNQTRYSRYYNKQKNTNLNEKKYNDIFLLDRMLKLGQLSLKSEPEPEEKKEKESVSRIKRTTYGKGKNGNLNLSCEDYENFIKNISKNE